MVRHESGLVPIFIGDFYLSVAAFTVQCQEILGITKRVDAFVHVRYAVRVLNGYCVQLVVVHAKSECSVMFGREYDGCHSFCLGMVNNIHRQHLDDLVFLKFLCAWDCLVWC